MIVPILGMQFRPPASGIVKCLPSGYPIVLLAEPGNEYDQLAIRVLVDLRQYPEDLWDRMNEEIAKWDWNAADLCSTQAPFMLGYVAKPREPKGKSPGVAVGNVQVYEVFGAEALSRGISGQIVFDGAGWPKAELGGATEMELCDSDGFWHETPVNVAG